MIYVVSYFNPWTFTWSFLIIQYALCPSECESTHTLWKVNLVLECFGTLNTGCDTKIRNLFVWLVSIDQVPDICSVQKYEADLPCIISILFIIISFPSIAINTTYISTKCMGDGVSHPALMYFKSVIFLAECFDPAVRGSAKLLDDALGKRVGPSRLLTQ